MNKDETCYMKAFTEKEQGIMNRIVEIHNMYVELRIVVNCRLELSMKKSMNK